MCGCLSSTPIGNLAHNQGMCPDWESNRRLFGSQASTQYTEPHQAGKINKVLKKKKIKKSDSVFGNCEMSKLICFHP